MADPTPHPPKFRASGRGQLGSLLETANDAIDESAQRHAEAAGIAPNKSLEHIRSDPAYKKSVDSAKKNVRDTLNAHFEPGKFEGDVPHLSHDSVRTAATGHFDAVHSGKLGGEVPASALWNDVHTGPTPAARKQELRDNVRGRTLERMASHATGEVSPETLIELQNRDVRLAGALPPDELNRLHNLEHQMTRTSGKHFSELTPQQQKARLDYLSHEHGHPDLQSRAVSHHETKDPGMFGRRGARRNAPSAISVDGQTLSHHYDGSVTRLHEGQTQMVQQGWDHQRISGRATNLAGMVENATANTAHAAHEATARAHVNSALGWMQTAEASPAQREALARLKPKHIDAVVKDYASRLHAGETFAHNSPHLTDALVHETGKPGALRSFATKYLPTFTRGADGVAHAASTTVSAIPHAPGAVYRAGGTALSATGAALATDVTPAFRATGRALGSAAVTTSNAISSASHTAFQKTGSFAKGAGKAVLITAGVGAGLVALNSLLSSSRPPRRMDNVNADMGSDPLIFTGNPDISIGALSVPQVGQQAQMGSWASRVPSMDQDMGIPTVPSR